MYRLIKLYFDIAILRKGPQDTPTSIWLLRVLISIYITLNVLVMLINGYVIINAFLQIGADLLIMLGFTWPLLHFSGKRGRFPQTLGALTGTDAIVTSFALPILAAQNLLPPEFIFFAMLILMAWHWIICGHIFRHALDKPIFFGLVYHYCTY